ncbi:MAG: hypothetical protein ACYS0K_14805 [Planctomycetota bacterium]
MRGFPLPSNGVTTLEPSVGQAAAVARVVSAAGLHGRVQGGQRLEPDGTSLGDLTSAMGDLGPGFSDDDGELVRGGGGHESFGPAVASSDRTTGVAFDWPDLSGIVELLVAKSSLDLVAKYRLPGQHSPRKKKMTKEDHMALAQSRNERRSRSLHILAAAFIGTFLVVVVLRKSGKGSYWW